MITGIHVITYATDAAAARAFFKDVLGFPNVNAGDGWLIFALPPGEIAAHPTDEPAQSGRNELYLMCDNVHKTVADLERKGVKFTQPVSDQGWGLLTKLRVPGAGEIGLYQPRHPVPTRTQYDYGRHGNGCIMQYSDLERTRRHTQPRVVRITRMQTGSCLER